jgi:glycosyltransferase involved in cell wall biosynthesis
VTGLRNAGLPDRSIALLPHGLRVADWPIAPSARHGIPLVGALGRIHPNKGFDVLLHAVRQLKDRGRAIRVVIAGADEAGSVASLAAQRDALRLGEAEVALPGWIDKPSEFLALLDVFCLPSRKETFGLALLEAMAAGRPVVASALPDLNGAFENGSEGCFAGPGDAGSLAGALNSLIADRALMEAMGERARSRAQSFDFNSIGTLYADTLSRLAKTGAA